MEVMIALAIFTLIVAATSVFVRSRTKQQALMAPANTLRADVRELHQQAIREMRPLAIRFSAFGYDLLRRYPVSEGLPESLEDEAEGTDESRIAGDDITVWVMGYDETKWREADGEVWEFPGSGICEPLSVRFQRGNAYVALTFDPLTANVTEQEAYIP